MRARGDGLWRSSDREDFSDHRRLQTRDSRYLACRARRGIQASPLQYAFEFGAFLGAKRFGSGRQKAKSCLVLDVERYRFQMFLSDIAGQDIASHDGDASKQFAVLAIGYK